jgi:hypothetical protein
MLRITRIALLVSLMPLAAAAQTLSLGSLPRYTSSTITGSGSVSIVDLSHPATDSGIVNSFSIISSAASCANTFTVRFLRSDPTFGTYTVIASRGPFTAVGGTNIIDLSPPVTVQRGDLLGITQTGGTSCGAITTAFSAAADSVMVLQDLSSNGTWFGGTLRTGVSVGMQASFNRQVLTHILPIVGSVAGNFGSQFRTVIQLTNPTATTVTGRLVFHPINTSGSSSDPDEAYSLSAHATQLLHPTETIFGVSGLGSVDVITTGTAPPLVSTRVFNDSGEAGTNGFAEDMVPVDDVIGAGQTVAIALPENIANYRMNIGIRTLGAGATLSVTYAQANGTTISTRTIDFPATTLRQMTVQDFANAAPVIDGTLLIKVTLGSAILYSTTTDNRTNDSALKYASRR